MRFSSSISFGAFGAFVMLSCSSGGSKAPPIVTREPLHQLARIPAFSAHLGEAGVLERTTAGFRTPRSDWKRVDGLEVTLSAGVTRIARSDDADAWIELTDLDEHGQVAVLGAPGEVHGGAVVFHDAAPATDVVRVVEATRFEEFRILRDPSAKTTSRARVRRGPGIAAVRLVDGRIEAVAVDGRVRLSSAPSFAIDESGTRRDLRAELVQLPGPRDASQLVLELALDATDLAYPITVDPLWTPTPNLASMRTLHAAAPLPGGKAMIAGGVRSPGSGINLATVLAYDPTAKTWTSLANMPSPADSLVLTVLSGGKIAHTGGNVSTTPFRGAEVYDPATDTWTSAGSISGPPQGSVVAALSGDRLLGVTQPAALLWSLATSSFTAAGTTTVTHDGHTATTLAGDAVLVVGGASTKVADLWDPATKTFSNGGTLSTFRTGHTATLLGSGKVLIAGGTGLASAELYDPATKTFSSAGTMSTVRTLHTATLLEGDRVLVVGGKDATGAALASTEIYDGATNTWSLGAPMATARFHHTATALPGPRVLVVAGDDGTSAFTTAEIFEPIAKGVACTKGEECTSGFCVDGVCCDKACGGQCEACDVAGKEGTCTAALGAPHGKRTTCEAGGAGVCARACDGTDHAACHFATSAVVCSTASCAAGTAKTQSVCDGAGNCPAATSVDCAPYACGAAACKTSCAGDADCGGANVCDLATKKCVVAAVSKCSTDGLREVPTDPAQPAKSCAPYLCDAPSGKCATRCTSASDCVVSMVCDVAVGVCKAPDVVSSGNPGDGGGGGCSIVRVGDASGAGDVYAFATVVGLAWSIARARRRRY